MADMNSTGAGPSAGDRVKGRGIGFRHVAGAAGLATLAAATGLCWLQAPRPDPFRPLRTLSAEWWLHARESNAFLRLAALDATLNAVHVAPDGRRIWVGGNGGVIAFSEDGGAHWVRQSVDYSAIPGAPSGPPAGDTPRKAKAATTSWLDRWVPEAHAGEADPPSSSGAAQQQARPSVPAPSNLRAPPGDARSNLSARPAADAEQTAKEPNTSGAAQTAVPPSAGVKEAATPAQPLGVLGAGADRCAGIRDDAARLACYDVGIVSPDAASGAKDKSAPAAATNARARVVPPRAPAAKDETPKWSGAPDWNAIAFSGDGQRGVVVGASGFVLLTDDGGNTWKAEQIASAGNLRAVVFDDAVNEAFIGGDTGALTLPHGPARRGSTGRAMFRPIGDVATVWVAGSQRIAAARTGLVSFAHGPALAPVALPGAEGEYRARTADGERIAMQRGDRTVVLRAGGRTDTPRWEELGQIPAAGVFALVRRSANELLAVAAPGRVFASNDDGRTWSPNSSLSSSVQGAIAAPKAAFDDSRAAWLVGTDGAVATLDRNGVARFHTRGAHGRLTAVTFGPSSAARDLWVGAASGAVFRLHDGGATLEPVGWLPGAVTDLSFSSDLDGAAGVAGGARFVTRNGGAFWSPAPNAAVAGAKDGAASGSTRSWPALQTGANTPRVLASAFSRDGNRYAEVGAAGWFRVGAAQGDTPPSPLAPYSRGAAPWVLVAGGLGLVLLLAAALAPPSPQVRRRSVADMLASDKPLERITGADPLKLGPLAEGLSRFLRNEATAPPLTLAITGEWGTGKSSLMNLLATDLRKYGVSVVNFNAWHHQKEEHLLASLLTSVKNQAPPRWLSLAGLEFRWHLGLARARKAPVLTAIVFLVLGAVAYLTFNPGPLDPFADLVKRIVESALDPSQKFTFEFSKLPEKVLGAGAFVTALVSGLTALRRLRAFGVDPAQLAASVAANFSLKDASAQASFRDRFARDFREVTTAMRSGSRPRVLTIFIDDLDRCRPEAVLEVLEAVNFLVSSGDCHVVLGMARARVEACVGLAFEKIAVEMVKLEREPGQAAVDADEARRKRREYARQYLEKLINVEVPMPTATIDQARAIVQDEAARRPDAGRMFAAPPWLVSTLSFWPLLLAAALFAAGVIGAQRLVRQPQAPVAAAVPAEVPKPIEGAPPITRPDNAPPPAAQSGGSGALFDAQDDAPAWIALTVLAVLGAAALLAAWIRRVDPVVHDSAEFKRALHVWLPVVVQRQNTPRAIKRFINRVRYLAMLRGESPPDAPDPGAMLVMMAALQFADPAYLHDVTAIADGDSRFTEDPKTPAGAAIAAAVREHGMLVDQAVSPERLRTERDWFEQHASTARMA